MHNTTILSFYFGEMKAKVVLESMDVDEAVQRISAEGGDDKSQVVKERVRMQLATLFVGSVDGGLSSSGDGERYEKKTKEYVRATTDESKQMGGDVENVWKWCWKHLV
ncbi:hypothetical protein CVT24_007784 [Panaeolus cyanescens]|uniref:Uncharacterized protein n=1 Tax=Panaeolus cyanescens TaxID=181874 RepID=A0A409WLE1_9AGAR|nr:hypothetical protein CVT24_007784 [Panaeolus cyanescens]